MGFGLAETIRKRPLEVEPAIRAFEGQLSK